VTPLPFTSSLTHPKSRTWSPLLSLASTSTSPVLLQMVLPRCIAASFVDFNLQRSHNVLSNSQSKLRIRPPSFYPAAVAHSIARPPRRTTQIFCPHSPLWTVGKDGSSNANSRRRKVSLWIRSVLKVKHEIVALGVHHGLPGMLQRFSRFLSSRTVRHSSSRGKCLSEWQR
jgi:hypothetical protein